MFSRGHEAGAAMMRLVLLKTNKEEGTLELSLSAM